MESSQFTISSIIIIVWLIFPGVVFKRFYFQGQFTKQFGAGLFADRLITSIFWGIVVQIITFLIYSRSFGFTFTGIKNKISSVYDNILENKLPDITYEHLKYILGYLIFLVIVAVLLGTISHKIIRLFKIDLKLEVFRFANHWNYYFRGEILSTREFGSLKKGKWLSTTVDMIIEDGTEKNKMISGLLTQYTICHSTGNLETLYLTGATRYSESAKKFKSIPGDCLIVPFDKVIDFNLRYTFQIINKAQRSFINFKNVVLLILSLGLIFISVFPWYLDINILLKILGIFTGGISWIFFIIIILNPFHPIQAVRFPSKDIWVFFLIMLGFLIATLLLLGIIPSIHQLKKIF